MISLSIAILLAILVAAITCYNNWKPATEDRYRKKNTIAIAFLIIAVLTQGLTFFNGYNAIQDKKFTDSLNVVKERENKILSDSLRMSQNKIISLQENLLDTTDRILLTSLNSNKLQKQLNDIQSEFYKQYIGNNAKPHVYPMAHQENFIAFVVDNTTSYPISDVSVSVVDNFEVRRDLGTLDLAKAAPYTLNYGRSYEIGVVVPGSAVIFYQRQIPPTWELLYYHFYVYYRTGSYKFYVRYERNEKGEFRLKSSHYTDLRTGKEFQFPSPKTR